MALAHDGSVPSVQIRTVPNPNHCLVHVGVNLSGPTPAGR